MDYTSSEVSLRSQWRSGWPRPSRPLRVRGQALILFMIALLVLCLGVLFLFNTGQVVGKKAQLVNAADAAAYSVAVQQARAYNLIAYFNRATVANEIAMAQVVSWYSWTNFAINGVAHLRDAMAVAGVVLSFFGVGEVLLEIAAYLQKAMPYLKRGRNLEQRLFNVAATAIATMNGAYSRATQLIGAAGSFDAAYLARKVVKLNAPKASIPARGVALLAADAALAGTGRYVQRHDIPAGRRPRSTRGADRFKNVVMEARDPFSRKRNDDWLFGLFKKRGGTDLVNYHNWVAVDTLNFEFTCPYFLCGAHGFPPHRKHFDVPLAWGGGAGIDKRSGSFRALARRDHGWKGPYKGNEPEYAKKGSYKAYAGALGNGKAASIALKDPTVGGTPWIKPRFGSLIRKLGGSVGLVDYDDIKHGRATVPYDNGRSASDNGVDTMDVGPVFTVLVVQPTDTVRTSDNVDGLGYDPAHATSGVFGGGADFKLEEKSVSNRLAAMGSAQVYFSRSRSLFPNPVDPRREMGSLFSPYWQARRVETPCKVRQGVALSHGAVAPCMP